MSRAARWLWLASLAGCAHTSGARVDVEAVKRELRAADEAFCRATLERGAEGFYPDEYRSRELGAGVTLRAGGGLVLGIDARVGRRDPVNPPILLTDALYYVDPGYRSLRLTAGISF